MDGGRSWSLGARIGVGLCGPLTSRRHVFPEEAQGHLVVLCPPGQWAPWPRRWFRGIQILSHRPSSARTRPGLGRTRIRQLARQTPRRRSERPPQPQRPSTTEPIHTPAKPTFDTPCRPLDPRASRSIESAPSSAHTIDDENTRACRTSRNGAQGHQGQVLGHPADVQ